MKVGDLVKTVEGWSSKSWIGIIIGMEASEDWVKILWTEAPPPGGHRQVSWAPVKELELINASR